MELAIESIKNHINNANLGIKTNKLYEGELKDSNKEPHLQYPAILHKANNIVYDNDFDIISVQSLLFTKSNTFNSTDNAKNNFHLTTQLCKYLNKEVFFIHQDKKYIIDKSENPVKAETLMQDKNLIVVLIRLVIKRA